MQSKDLGSVGAAAQYWIWGYPLLNMAMAAATTGVQQQAINKLVGQPTLVNPQNQRAFGVVTPNVDTLYVNGWLGAYVVRGEGFPQRQEVWLGAFKVGHRSKAQGG